MKPVNDNKNSQLVNKQTLGDLNTGLSKVNDGKVLPLKFKKGIYPTEVPWLLYLPKTNVFFCS